MEQFNLQNKQFILIGGRSQRKIQGRQLKTKGTKRRKKKNMLKRRKNNRRKNERKIWKKKE